MPVSSPSLLALFATIRALSSTDLPSTGTQLICSAPTGRNAQHQSAPRQSRSARRETGTTSAIPQISVRPPGRGRCWFSRHRGRPKLSDRFCFPIRRIRRRAHVRGDGAHFSWQGWPPGGILHRRRRGSFYVDATLRFGFLTTTRPAEIRIH
jgi:hypothetical protein